MILLVSKLDKLDHDPRYSIDFQGKKLSPIACMIFWYRWGEYTFDIRAVRKALGKEEIQDYDLRGHSMGIGPKFQKIAAEIIDIVGETPFMELFSGQDPCFT